MSVKFYQVLVPIGFTAGQVLTLPKETITRRADFLRHLDGDRYELKSNIDFKAGEIIGLEGKQSHAMLEKMICLDEVSQDSVSNDNDVSKAEEKAEKARLKAEEKAEKARLKAEEKAAKKTKR